MFNCYTLVLPVKLLYFNYEGNRNGKHVFKFKVDDPSTLKDVVLEAGDGTNFQPMLSFYSPFSSKEIEMAMDVLSFPIYRLKLTSQAGIVSYSQEVKVNYQNTSAMFWPNPVSDKIFMKIKAVAKGKVFYSIINSRGQEVVKSNIEVREGVQTIFIKTDNLSGGMYYLKVAGVSLLQPSSFRFIK